MNNEVARFDEARYAMNQVLIKEINYLERGLPWLAATYRVAVPLGCLGTILPLFISPNGAVISRVSIPAGLAQTMLPLAMGLTLSLIFFVVHFQLNRTVRRMKYAYQEATDQMVKALGQIDGVASSSCSKVSPGIHIQGRRRELKPNLRGLARLNIIQATCIFFFLIVQISLFGPPGWAHPHLDTPTIFSGDNILDLPYKPGLWLSRDGTFRVNDPQTGIRLVAVEEIDEAVATIHARQQGEWALVADKDCPYSLIEDALETLRLAGVSKITFCGK